MNIETSTLGALLSTSQKSEPERRGDTEFRDELAAAMPGVEAAQSDDQKREGATESRSVTAAATRESTTTTREGDALLARERAAQTSDEHHARAIDDGRSRESARSGFPFDDASTTGTSGRSTKGKRLLDAGASLLAVSTTGEASRTARALDAQARDAITHVGATRPRDLRENSTASAVGRRPDVSVDGDAPQDARSPRSTEGEAGAHLSDALGLLAVVGAMPAMPRALDRFAEERGSGLLQQKITRAVQTRPVSPVFAARNIEALFVAHALVDDAAAMQVPPLVDEGTLLFRDGESRVAPSRRESIQEQAREPIEDARASVEKMRPVDENAGAPSRDGRSAMATQAMSHGVDTPAKQVLAQSAASPLDRARIALFEAVHRVTQVDVANVSLALDKEHSRLSLVLPNNQRIDVSISVDGDRVHMRLVGEGAQVLALRGRELASAMNDAGLTLVGVDVDDGIEARAATALERHSAGDDNGERHPADDGAEEDDETSAFALANGRSRAGPLRALAVNDDGLGAPSGESPSPSRAPGSRDRVTRARDIQA
jgi:hypothetical protein